MVGITRVSGEPPAGDGLSENAKKILRHFREKKLAKAVYEYPDTLRKLFETVEECESALEELSDRGLVDRMPMAQHAADRVTASALTLDGVRYIEKADLD